MNKPRRTTSYIIGIDEVGRGPLAGPVVIAAVCIPSNFRHAKILGTVRDSKKLTELQRETWSGYLRQHPSVRYAFARVNAARIDKLNITKAANRAVQQALRQLERKQGVAVMKARITLDGGLYIKDKATQQQFRARTMPKADDRVPVVAYASILAKVHRDAYMKKKAKEFPAYGFEQHKGYGTRLHRRALKKHGPTPLHRLTFVPVSRTLR
jgi:ribonuclease HII